MERQEVHAVGLALRLGGGPGVELGGQRRPIDVMARRDRLAGDLQQQRERGRALARLRSRA